VSQSLNQRKDHLNESPQNTVLQNSLNASYQLTQRNPYSQQIKKAHRNQTIDSRDRVMEVEDFEMKQLRREGAGFNQDHTSKIKPIDRRI
jgi:hypothetical protein